MLVLATSLAVVGVMFWWGAREDGRDQQRIDAQLRDKRAEERRLTIVRPRTFSWDPNLSGLPFERSRRRP